MSWRRRCFIPQIAPGHNLAQATPFGNSLFTLVDARARSTTLHKHSFRVSKWKVPRPSHQQEDGEFLARSQPFGVQILGCSINSSLYGKSDFIEYHTQCAQTFAEEYSQETMKNVCKNVLKRASLCLKVCYNPRCALFLVILRLGFTRNYYPLTLIMTRDDTFV